MIRTAARGGQETALASVGGAYLRLLEMHGLDAAGIFREAGLDPHSPPTPGAQVPVDAGDRIILKAAALIPGTAFGLHAARCWQPAHFGLLGHAWLTSTNLRGGLKCLVRYWRIATEISTLSTEDTADGIRFVYERTVGDPLVVAVAADIAMSIVLDMCRMAAGASLTPLEVTLKRFPYDEAEVYRRFYGCPVVFGTDRNSFVLACSEVDRVLPTANQQLASVLDQMLATEIARLRKGDLEGRCRAVVLENLASGEISEEDTAKRLNVSRRSLQRRLAEAGTSFMEIVDGARKDMALRYIEDPRRSITDITFALGFSQQSAFTRAFRRWTGHSPSQYRARPAQHADE
jgi:AraC-like DNA-binding protein